MPMPAEMPPSALPPPNRPKPARRDPSDGAAPPYSARSLHALPPGLTSPPAGVYRERRRRLCAQGQKGLLLLARGDAPFYEDLFYLTGLTTYHSALLLDLETGEEQVWVWQIEEEEAHAQTDVAAVLSFDPFASPAPLLDLLLQKIQQKKPHNLFFGLQGGGIVPFTLELHANLAMQAGEEVRHSRGIQEAAPLLAPLRRIKDAWEVSCLARAQRNAEATMTQVLAELRVGMTEREVAGRILERLIAGGATRPSFPIVAFGAHTANTHHLASDRALHSGDLVLVDIYGEAADQYSAEWTDTILFESRDSAVSRPLQTVDEVLRKLQAQLRPGVTLAQLENHAFELLTLAGLGTEYPGACAHDVGLSEHDPTDKTLPLQPGQVIALEPSVYSQRAQHGIRRERAFMV